MAKPEVVFTYLHDDHARKEGYIRLDARSIQVVLSDGTEYIIPYDERDRRTLVIFDGDIPCNGLPKIASEAAELATLELLSKKNHVRRPKSFELPHPHAVPGDESLRVILTRRAILLPAGTALIVRYRQGSLAACYCFLEVVHGDNGPNVVFRNTDY